MRPEKGCGCVFRSNLPVRYAAPMQRTCVSALHGTSRDLSFCAAMLRVSRILEACKWVGCGCA